MTRHIARPVSRHSASIRAVRPEAADLGFARRALVGLVALAIVVLGTLGWAHTDRPAVYASQAASQTRNA